MFPEPDIWRAAILLLNRFGDDARMRAAMRADELLIAGDSAGAATWAQIKKAVEELRPTALSEGEKPH